MASGTKREPLASPHGALARIRKMRRRKPASGGVTVMLHEGIYPLSRPLTFRPADSGTAEAPLTFAAAPGATVVLSGGRPLNGWTRTRVNGKACWMTEVPEVKRGEQFFTQLFINGHRRQRARLPKKGWFRFNDYVRAKERTPKWHCGPRRMYYKAGDLKPWKNLSDIRLLTPEYWFASDHRIRRIDTRRRIVHFKTNSVASLHDEKQKCARYFVENVFEALSEPGEWYLDRKSGKCFYIPMPGEEPESVVGIAPILDKVIFLAGTAKQPVTHIRFENLSIQHAEWMYPADDAGSVQSSFKVPGAVILKAARHCMVYGCEVTRTSTWGIETRNGCHDNHVLRCSVHDVGAGGIKIGHEWMSRIDETSTHIIKPISDLPSATTVSDCSVHNVGTVHLTGVGIWVGNAGGNRIVHNEVFDIPYTGISCGWTWADVPTATTDNCIEDNHVHHIGCDRNLSDNGGIYILGQHPGSTVRRNHIHDVQCYGYGGTGIYTDEGAAEIRVENNLVHHTTNAGCFTHVGRDIVIRNNIFAMAKAQHLRLGNRGDFRANIFVNNIVCWKDGELGKTNWGLQSCRWEKMHYLCYGNLFWNAGGEVSLVDDKSLGDLQREGQHEDTRVADPLFMDAGGGDFTLREDSPAIALGFNPFSLPDAGPRRVGTRSCACARPRAWKPRPVLRTSFNHKGKGVVEMTIRNAGHVAAGGRLRLQALPATSARIVGVRSVTVTNLKPGKSLKRTIKLQLDDGEEMVTLESVTRSACMVPAMLHIARGPETS